MNNINITLEDKSTLSVPAGTTVESLAGTPAAESGLPYIGALVNNDVSSMSYPLSVTSHVKFLTMADPYGWRIYRHSLCFLLAKTVRDIFPSAVFSVEHSFGLGLFCSFQIDPNAPNNISKEQLTEIDAHMRHLIEQNIPIERRKISFIDAIKRFKESGQIDKLNLLRFRNPPRVVVHWCDGFSDLAHGPLAPDTGVLSRFELIHYQSGFVLHYPDRSDPLNIPPFEDQPHLFNIFREHKQWGKILNVTTVGRLNETIAEGDLVDFIRTAEALHEKKIAQIADTIADAKDKLKLVLIAGPSSAGKTTFAKRLAIHLKVNGIRPVTLGTDDYFVGEERNPRDENGKPDYEHIEAVDLELFNNDLLKLVQGETIDVPHFNFETKQREYRGETLRIDNDQMVIIEGIHGLNPRLTDKLPANCEFKIYISALTQLSLDSNNRISTTDNRLMRRMIRDCRFRGHPAIETLRMWPSVRRGEKMWIFPFQREADATFNSALDYELAILKPYVEPLLMQVNPSHREYAEARRLSEFLLHFLTAPDQPVPASSILREYIGGSQFHY
ncbi:MAG: nucleoside kinase [Kiritimatiellae bacterium]|nr:nucleoside kinase [Kiritimatiellia bacterium]